MGKDSDKPKTAPPEKAPAEAPGDSGDPGPLRLERITAGEGRPKITDGSDRLPKITDRGGQG